MTIRVVDIDGNPHTASGLTDGVLPLARCISITRTKNQPAEAIIAFPKYEYTRADVHVFTNDTGAGDLHYLEVVRDDNVRFRGPAIQADTTSTDGEVRLHCRGIDWILWRNYLDAQRTNLLDNPSFETGDLTGWNGSGGLDTEEVTTADAIRGTHSLRLESNLDLGDVYEEQNQTVVGTGVGTFVTVAFYFRLVSITGHAIDRRGLYIEARESGVFKINDFYAIDEATPVGHWIRATAHIQVPPNKTWVLNVRLYSPPGEILWDDGQLVAMQSISTASITGSTVERVDVSEIVGLITAFIQDPTVGKFDLHLTLDAPTVGVMQVKHIQWADHISWADQMAEWLEREDCFDYSIRNNIDGTNELVLHVPVQGTDRRDTTTLTFPGNVAHYEVTEDGGSTITDDTQLEQDTGDGPDREEGHYADATLVGGLVLQAVDTAPPKSEPSSLVPIARDKVNRNRRPALLFTLELRGFELLLGTPYDELLGLWDAVLIDVTDGWMTIDGFGRIAQIVEYPRNRRLVVTIAKAIPA